MTLESHSLLQRTALYEAHQQAGARLVPFAGWEMPVQYAGVLSEARAVREGCGLFDVSHMGQLMVSGSEVTQALNAVVSADWSGVEIGRAAYALLVNELGGVQDDIMGYRLADDRWLVIVNASRATADEAHFRAHLPADVSMHNCYANQAMIAIQGPISEAVVQPLCSSHDLSQMKWRDVYEHVTLAGVEGILARGGYTGSDGFEFMFEGEDAPQVWQALVAGGGTPCGLGARDALRLEAGLPLYGHELREAWTPYESGCGWAVKPAKGDFVGRAALEGKDKPTYRIRAVKMEGRGIPREGYPVLHEGKPVGEVTSGTLSPFLNIGVALALLPVELAPDTPVQVEIRGTAHPAQIVKPPFVSHQARK